MGILPALKFALQLLWDGHLARPDPKGKILALQTNQQITFNLPVTATSIPLLPTPYSLFPPTPHAG